MGVFSWRPISILTVGGCPVARACSVHSRLLLQQSPLCVSTNCTSRHTAASLQDLYVWLHFLSLENLCTIRSETGIHTAWYALDIDYIQIAFKLLCQLACCCFTSAFQSSICPLFILQISELWKCYWRSVSLWLCWHAVSNPYRQNVHRSSMLYVVCSVCI